MDQIVDYLQALPDESFIKSICLLIFTSCSGLIPNNNDISLAAAGLITQLKQLSPFYILMMTALSWMLGETVVFFIGKIIGRKLLNLGFIQRKMNLQRQQKIEKMINENPFSLIIMIRLTPILRAISILTMGSLGLSSKHFFTKHLPLLFSYATLIFFFFYFGGILLKNIFAENSLIVMIIIALIWFTVMIFVGRKFLKKLQ